MPRGLERAVDGVSGVEGVRLPTDVPPTPFNDFPTSGDMSGISLIGSFGHIAADVDFLFGGGCSCLLVGSLLTDMCIMPSLERESSSIFVSNELTLPVLLPAPLLFLVVRSIIIPGGKSQFWQLFLSSICLSPLPVEDLPCLPVVVPELCESLSSPSSPCLLIVCRLCFIRLF